MKNKLCLPNVTLFAATSVEVEQANFNLKISSDPRMLLRIYNNLEAHHVAKKLN